MEAIRATARASRRLKFRWLSRLVGLIATGVLIVWVAFPESSPSRGPGRAQAAQASARSRVRTKARKPPMVVLGYSELGMHCMNQDFSEICILPPFNTMHAQVIDRSGEEPRIVRNGPGIAVRYNIPGNTYSAGKTNFWQFAQALFGTQLKPNVGLTGSRLSGTMTPSGSGDWVVTGIPLTPIKDNGAEDPYQLSRIWVLKNGAQQAQTQAVVPVSWEISCDLCHVPQPGVSVATDILRKHDTLHGTQLEAHKPVLCASCHADPALGATGQPGVPSMSMAMHGAHASRMDVLTNVENKCYACHPGFRTNCQRDVHFANGIFCTDCHGTMADVANPARTPWVTEPRCENCHQSRRPDFAFEEPGKLYKQSRGHQGVMCAACHGSPHAITPTVTAADNVQAIQLQGHPGTIDTCTVCHKKNPDDRFPHRLDGD